MKKRPKLNQFERDRIQAFLADGHRQKDIAKVLKRDKGTISREIRRHQKKNGQYDAQYAQHLAYVKRKYAKYQGKKINEDENLKDYLVEGLENCWNPDEISGRMRRTGQSFYSSKTAIYEWLYSCWGQRYCCLLPSKQYRKKRQKELKAAGREMIPDRVGIEKRPSAAEHEMGHLEHDTFVSGRKTGSKAAVSVLCEPKAAYLTLRKIPNQKPRLNESAVQDMLSGFKNLKSLTRDNGLENKCHRMTGIPSFFCDPYSAWQKAHVENIIKLLRRFFKKGSDLNKYADEEILFVQNVLNNKPRKILGYKTPLEVMLENDMLNPEKINRQEVVLTQTINRLPVAIEG